MDVNRLRQVLLNLLTNAIKFTRNGIIHVSCKLKNDGTTQFVQVSVRDQGIGIRLNDQEKLFKPFSRLENGQMLNPNGIGLGLNYCKEILENMGGKIWLKSSFLKKTGS